MIDEKGVELSDRDLLRGGLELIADACCQLYEIESAEGHAVAYMADAVLRYGQAVYNDRDPRLSPEFVELANLDLDHPKEMAALRAKINDSVNAD